MGRNTLSRQRNKDGERIFNSAMRMRKRHKDVKQPYILSDICKQFSRTKTEYTEYNDDMLDK